MRFFQNIQYTAVFALFFAVCGIADAATLRLSPDTGIFTVGKNIAVNVLINTDGKSVNASDGQISFNPRELQVVSVSRASSIYNLWTEEPTYSNSAGTVSFGGGSPTGYKGTGGNVITIVFRPLGSGNPKIQFKSGSILAADGLGTNVLTGMAGATYTISAPTENPEPEYIAPPNTPKVPVVVSSTHQSEAAWYTAKTAKVSWELPNDVVAIRTLLDQEKNSIPSIVYEERVTEKELTDLAEGTSYFHIQFKNSAGWGKIAHFKINVDTEKPQHFTISDESTDNSNAVAVLGFTLEDISPITKYKIQVDGKDPFEFEDVENKKQYGFTEMQPGYHTVSVEAFDSAGNSEIATHSFTIEALPKPWFLEFPRRINTEVIPAIKGKTVPHAHVAITVTRASDGTLITPVYGNENNDPFTLESDDNGEFLYIPKSSFERGVYDIVATARDAKGRLSEVSDPIRIIVDAPGYIVVGTLVVNILSVMVPLIALLLLATFGLWYVWHKLRVWRKKVMRETLDAEQKLKVQFDTIVRDLHEKVALLKESRKGKLTKAELDLIEQMEHDLSVARTNLSKEITDIEDVIT